METSQERKEALSQGLKDETCKKCERFFPAECHFIRCSMKSCPMGNGKSFLDMLNEYFEQKDREQNLEFIIGHS